MTSAALHRGFQVVGDGQAHRFGGGAGAAPHGEAGLGKSARIGLNHRARDRARRRPAGSCGCPCARGVWPTAGCPRRSSTWSPGGKSRSAVNSPVTSSKSVDDAVDRRLAARGIAGNDGAHLDQRAKAVDPGGPVQQGIRAPVEEEIGDVGPGQAVAGLERLRSGRPRSDASRPRRRIISTVIGRPPFRSAGPRRPGAAPSLARFRTDACASPGGRRR